MDRNWLELAQVSSKASPESFSFLAATSSISVTVTQKNRNTSSITLSQLGVPSTPGQSHQAEVEEGAGPEAMVSRDLGQPLT